MHNPRVNLWLVVIVTFCAAVLRGPEAAAQPIGPPLKRGVNLNAWFVHRNSFPADHLKSYLTAADFAAMKAMGLDHVRLPIDQGPLWNEGDPSILNPAYLPLIDEAIDKILGAGLDVVVDLHAGEAFNIKLRGEGEALERAARFWQSLAAHLSKRDPRRVALEALNEPTVETVESWQRIAVQLAAAIRRGAPRHTIIVTGARWSHIDDLVCMKPLEDRNIIYTFHMYEPFTFTHQGAAWGVDYWKLFRGVPYPSSPEAVEKMLPALGDESSPARKDLWWYGRQRWDAARVERMIALASAWAERHGVKLWCGEFGVHRPFAPPADRARWVHDVRTSLERHDIGWALWDYDADFGMMTRAGNERTADPAMLDALGLSLPHP